MDNLELMHKKIQHFVSVNWKKSFNEPQGVLKHKFLEPAAVYRAQLWDWDSYFCGLALIDVYDDTAEYLKGCCLNFLDYQRKDGSVPYMINVANNMEALPEIDISERDENCDINSVKPLLAQMALCVYRKTGEKDWIKNTYDKLNRHIGHWEDTQQCENGLFVWRSYRGSGTDNHPALYGRPLNSSAAVELNCFMYAEYKAMSEISKLCGDLPKSEKYLEKSEKLACDINKNMWDSIDGVYYHLDMLSAKPPLARQDISWNVPLKFKTWTCFMPMYAGIAPKEYAKRMVEEHITNKDEFWSDFGIRTLAKNEPAYSVVETSNPSNWQGPIWIVSTYLVFKGLLNYGFYDKAELLCKNLLSNLCSDIDENGAMHEYYNPETGKSNINLGFMNWNALAGLMVPELRKYGKK